MSGMHRDRLTGPRRPRQRLVQLVSAVLMNGYLVGFQKGRIFTGRSKAICVPVLNCYSCPGALGACPIGALQSSLGGFGRQFPFYTLGLLMLFGVVLGRVACGLLCPFGLVQDLLHKIPLPKLQVPKKLDRLARGVKYLVLVVLVFLLPALVIPASGVTPPYFCKYLCPAGTLGGGIPLMLTSPALRDLAGALFHWKVLVLAVILLAAINRRIVFKFIFFFLSCYIADYIGNSRYYNQKGYPPLKLLTPQEKPWVKLTSQST